MCLEIKQFLKMPYILSAPAKRRGSANSRPCGRGHPISRPIRISAAQMGPVDRRATRAAILARLIELMRQARDISLCSRTRVAFAQQSIGFRPARFPRVCFVARDLLDPYAMRCLKTWELRNAENDNHKLPCLASNNSQGELRDESYWESNLNRDDAPAFLSNV